MVSTWEHTIKEENNMSRVEELRKRYVGKKVHVIINDPYHYVDAWGTVEHVDDMGQLHGSWGGCAVILDEDSYRIIDADKCL